jgi:hypothetical protein
VLHLWTATGDAIEALGFAVEVEVAVMLG